MQGFASELLGEVFTKGKGPFGQIGIPLGQPLNSEYAGVALAVWVSCHCYLCGAPSILPPCVYPLLYVGACIGIRACSPLVGVSVHACIFVLHHYNKYDALACRWASSCLPLSALETLASRRATMKSTERLLHW